MEWRKLLPFCFNNWIVAGSRKHARECIQKLDALQTHHVCHIVLKQYLLGNHTREAEASTAKLKTFSWALFDLVSTVHN
jgi:hypothetical protein